MLDPVVRGTTTGLDEQDVESLASSCVSFRKAAKTFCIRLMIRLFCKRIVDAIEAARDERQFDLFKLSIPNGVGLEGNGLDSGRQVRRCSLLMASRAVFRATLAANIRDDGDNSSVSSPTSCYSTNLQDGAKSR